MPEYPDVTVYTEKLNELVKGKTIENIRIVSFFLVRTANPPIASVKGKTVDYVERMGKRIVFILNGEYYLVVHLMIAGRFHWKPEGARIPKSNGLAAIDFPNGTLILTETGSKKMASMHLFHEKSKLDEINPHGLEIFETTLSRFKEILVSENHTLKRALTDPYLFSGIGNAYSDEILHRAGLSPILLTQKMDDKSIEILFQATKDILKEWTERLRNEARNGFPENVTAFHDEMAVHGKFGKPCPVCGTQIQRIRYESNETNYCPKCQTGGKLLADRALSRLLKSDWPKTVEDWEKLFVKK